MSGDWLWHLYTKEGGTERMRALLFNANGTRTLTPWSYNEDAFRQLAVPLIVNHALSRASEPGDDTAKLEVYLKGNQLLEDPSRLSIVSPADSPVGFDPAKEVQLVAASMWGDNAVYITIDKTTGVMRTDDFN